MNDIYADILLICCDIILSYYVVSGWVLPTGFFTQVGVGMGQNVYPGAGRMVGKILGHGYGFG
jgi:hypothetical protein